MQSRAGNQATLLLLRSGRWPEAAVVRRAPTIHHFDYNTDKGSGSDATIPVPELRAALGKKVRGNTLTRVLGNLDTNADYVATDVADLAQCLTQGIADAPVADVQEAIGNLLQGPGLDQWTEVEAEQNDKMLRVPEATLSRAKGTPNTIPLDKLDNATGANYAGRIAQVKTLNAATRQAKYADLNGLAESYFLQHLAGAELDIRSCHTNGAKWLPDDKTTARYDEVNGKVLAAIAHKNTAKTRGKEETFRFPEIMNLKANERRDFIWTAHCKQFMDSPYVEISIPGHKDLRLMYQCVTRKFYATVHYKWQRGYNPFFEIRGV